MESKGQYTNNQPAYAPPASNPYPAAGTAPTPYPVPVPAPGPTTYPPPGPQQYPPPSQYPPPAQQYQPAPGQAPYVQPPAGYPPQPAYVTPQYFASPPQQQQQQQVVVVSAGLQQQPVIVQHVPSYVGHIVFACIVLWCCNWLFGLIAFILASQYSFCCHFFISHYQLPLKYFIRMTVKIKKKVYLRSTILHFSILQHVNIRFRPVSRLLQGGSPPLRFSLPSLRPLPSSAFPSLPCRHL